MPVGLSKASEERATVTEHSFMDQYVQRPPPPPRGYSLAALFLLVTTSGIIAALARSATLHVEWKIDGGIVAHAAIGLLIGVAVGSLTAHAYPRRLQGQLLGGAVGGVTGGVCAAVAAAGASLWLYLLGALALVGMGLLARFGQQRRKG